MDFVTHSLIGANLARLCTREERELPTLSIAAVLASLLMDGDSWVALLGPDMYGRWHRVVSHSMPGLALCAAAAWGIAMAAWRIPATRRFGWFVTANLPKETAPLRPSSAKTIAVCLFCAFLHATADMITGFGNMQLLWPALTRDFSLHAVTSFDWPIFAATMLWHMASRRESPGSARLHFAGLAWLAAVSAYVVARLFFGQPTVW